MAASAGVGTVAHTAHVAAFPTSWQLGLVADAVIALVYVLIVLAIVGPSARGHRLRGNPLAIATAAVFLTCAVHHGLQSLHMLLPALGVDDPQGLATRRAWGWPLALWDVAGAAAGLYYWTLRRHHPTLVQRGQLFEDLRQRELQGVQLNDDVLQGLVVAKMALDLDDPVRAQHALASAIDSASRIITDLIGGETLPSEPSRAATDLVAADPHGRTPE